MYYVVAILYVLNSLVLMLVILLQQGKGGDIANAFGGGSSQAAFGARSGATVLSRATTVCAVLFVVGAIALGILGQYEGGSVVGGRAPLVQPSTPGPAPTPTSPTGQTPANAAPAASAPGAPAAPSTPTTTPAPAPAK